MAERYVSSENGFGASPLIDALSSVEIAPIVRIEDYRSELKRHQILQQIGQAATLHRKSGAADNLPSLDPLSVNDYPNGDINVKFIEYQRGFPDGKHGIPHPGGWSGGPETKRVLVARFAAESGSVEFGYLHPRNFRYLISELEAKRQTGDNEAELQLLRAELSGP